MKEEFSKLLNRQLRKTNIDYSACDEAVKSFIDIVNETYKLHSKEIKLTQRAMNLSSDELQEKNKKLNEAVNLSEQFAFIVAHDLKEPLRTINSFLNILFKKNKDKLADSTSQEYIQFIHLAVRRMESYLNDLMNFLIINKDNETSISDINLNEIIENCKSDLFLQIKEKNAQIINNNLPTIAGYKNHFVQLFLNLISNALKFNKSDEKPIIKI